jgi:hypothetical protein
MRRVTITPPGLGTTHGALGQAGGASHRHGGTGAFVPPSAKVGLFAYQDVPVGGGGIAARPLPPVSLEGSSAYINRGELQAILRDDSAGRFVVDASISQARRQQRSTVNENARAFANRRLQMGAETTVVTTKQERMVRVERQDGELGATFTATDISDEAHSVVVPPLADNQQYYKAKSGDLVRITAFTKIEDRREVTKFRVEYMTADRDAATFDKLELAKKHIGARAALTTKGAVWTAARLRSSDTAGSGYEEFVFNLNTSKSSDEIPDLTYRAIYFKEDSQWYLVDPKGNVSVHDKSIGNPGQAKRTLKERGPIFRDQAASLESIELTTSMMTSAGRTMRQEVINALPKSGIIDGDTVIASAVSSADMIPVLQEGDVLAVINGHVATAAQIDSRQYNDVNIRIDDYLDDAQSIGFVRVFDGRDQSLHWFSSVEAAVAAFGIADHAFTGTIINIANEPEKALLARSIQKVSFQDELETALQLEGTEAQIRDYTESGQEQVTTVYKLADGRTVTTTATFKPGTDIGLVKVMDGAHILWYRNHAEVEAAYNIADTVSTKHTLNIPIFDYPIDAKETAGIDRIIWDPATKVLSLVQSNHYLTNLAAGRDPHEDMASNVVLRVEDVDSMDEAIRLTAAKFLEIQNAASAGDGQRDGNQGQTELEEVSE